MDETLIKITTADTVVTARLPLTLTFYYGDVGYWNGIVHIGRGGRDDRRLVRRNAAAISN